MHIVNKKTHRTTSRDIYIGRPRGGGNEHFGNPFTHLGYGSGVVRLGSRLECVQAYRDWLLGREWGHVEPYRRDWIVTQLATRTEELAASNLVCWCAPLACHGDVIRDIVLTHLGK